MRNSDSIPFTTASALLLAACAFVPSCITAPGLDADVDGATWEPEPADPVNTALPEGVPTEAIASQDSPDEMLRQDARLLELKEQRRAFLVDQHLASCSSEYPSRFASCNTSSGTASTLSKERRYFSTSASSSMLSTNQGSIPLSW